MTDRPARMQEGVARTYRTDRIEVEWEPKLCIHAATCFRTLPEVFEPREKPWVRPEAAEASSTRDGSRFELHACDPGEDAEQDGAGEAAISQLFGRSGDLGYISTYR